MLDLFDRSEGLSVDTAPALIWHEGGLWWCAPGQSARQLSPQALSQALTKDAPLVCHMPALARRGGLQRFRALDVLELFAFVRPARTVTPTPRSLRAALDIEGLPEGASPEEQAGNLRALARALLAEATGLGAADRVLLSGIWITARAHWPWAQPLVRGLAAAAGDAALDPGADQSRALRVWERMDTWEDEAALGRPGTDPVTEAEARTQLSKLLSLGRGDVEERPSQSDFASAVSQAFHPREERESPHMVLAEAGTGVGKTLGYLAPATVWAGKNKGSVWVSTYTRALQRQIDQETDRLFADGGAKNRSVVVRKGRENYLCLLNLQETGQAGGLSDRDRIGLVITARWAERSRNGDMVGGDFPAWLIDLFGGKVTTDLTDQRGECLYSGCPHYGKCGIEKNIRNARNARLVIANHALVLNQAGQGPESDLSEHVVFDEGHHLFDASDSFFSAGLSGMETAELRRWLLGPESDRRGRGRGLRVRMEEVVTLDPRLPDLLKHVEQGAYALPGPGWYQRLRDGTPDGAGEYFLSFVGEQVYARADKPGDPFSIECTPRPPVTGLLAAAREFGEALGGLLKPVQDLRACLIDVLEQPTEQAAEQSDASPDGQTADGAGNGASGTPGSSSGGDASDDRPVQWKSQADARRRAEAMVRSLERRAIDPLTAWSAMLRDLETDPPPDFVDWFSVERVDGRDRDLGYYRHFIDPMKPFSQLMAQQVQGFVVTSATLTDPVADAEDAWGVAEERTGARHLRNGAFRARVASPYDYANQAEVLIVGDVPKNQPGALAAAFESLFKASGGGGIGLFTAIRRLRGVYDRIRTPLEESGLPLFAQHVDAMDTGTLVDIFRDETNACLLGTDAVRDGVDVPGDSLRLLAFERVPWPRPDILHRARRDAFGGRALDDMLARAKLRQAFGRLIRRQTDRGVFVLLDPMMPSRLESAFPSGVPIHRLGLDEACERIRAFLPESQPR